MSDKPEAPERIWIDDHCDIDVAEIYAEQQFDTVEYIRADLAKPSEWIERKAKAFDWFTEEMMDEELEILMKKGGHKTPLEAIEKAMIKPPPTNQRNPMTCPTECPTCKKYQAFIQAMIAEFEKYNANKTALYYKGQCEKILEQNSAPKSK